MSPSIPSRRDDGELKGTQTRADRPMRRLTDVVVWSLYISYPNISNVVQLKLSDRSVLLDVQTRGKRLRTSLVHFELLPTRLGRRGYVESLRHSGLRCTTFSSLSGMFEAR